MLTMMRVSQIVVKLLKNVEMTEVINHYFFSILDSSFWIQISIVMKILWHTLNIGKTK